LAAFVCHRFVRTFVRRYSISTDTADIFTEDLRLRAIRPLLLPLLATEHNLVTVSKKVDQ